MSDSGGIDQQCRSARKLLKVASLDLGMNKVWEGQWSSQRQEWPIFHEDADARDVHNITPNCVSPSASETSSSSTQDCSLFSGKSETSSIAGKNADFQSPKLLSSRFSGFSLFNPEINHAESLCTEKYPSILSKKLAAFTDEQQEQLLVRGGDILIRLVESKQSPEGGSVDCLGCEFDCAAALKECRIHGMVKDHLDDGNSSDTKPWASASSQKLLWQGRTLGADNIHLEVQCGSRERSASVEAHDCTFEDLHAKAPSRQHGEPVELLSNNIKHCKHLHGTEDPCENRSFTHAQMACNDGNIYDSDSQGLKNLVCKPNCYLENGSSKFCNISMQPHRLGRPLQTWSNIQGAASILSMNIGKTRHGKSRYSAAVEERFPSSSLHGYLRFAEQGGSPYYSFFLNGTNEVFFARACRQERRSNKENSDCIYTFHSRKDNGKVKRAWKSGPKKEKPPSDLVAKMNVSIVRASNSTCGQIGRMREAHFVLFDAKVAQETQETDLEGPKWRYYSAGTFEAGVSRSRLEPCSTNYDTYRSHANERPALDDFQMGDSLLKSCPANLANAKNVAEQKDHRGIICHLPRAELVAIVINTSVKEKKTTKRKESNSSQQGAGGWGVKFLGNGLKSGWGLSFLGQQLNPVEVQTREDACASMSAEVNSNKDSYTKPRLDSSTQKPEHKLTHRQSKHSKLKVDVTVVLPAGDHGLPKDEKHGERDRSTWHGPTPLLERWRSGGECDCGGWDMGCGLSVLKADPFTLQYGSGANLALTRNDGLDWLSPGNPFKISTQGCNRKVLVLEAIETGVFSLRFHARFSPLQAFAVAVAMFHQQHISHKC